MTHRPPEHLLDVGPVQRPSTAAPAPSPGLHGHQDLVPERWERTGVDDRGVVLAVYRGWVVPSDPVHRLPDCHPGRVTGLRRALFDEQPELQAAAAKHTLQRADEQDRLQQVESVKQLAQLFVPALGRVPQSEQRAATELAPA